MHNLSIDRHPALIARAADAADVVRAINFARVHELPLAVRSGGHSMAGYGSVEGGLVIDLSRDLGFTIDEKRRVAWAQAGLTWGEYAERANAIGLATTAGDTASVGVAGRRLAAGSAGWFASMAWRSTTCSRWELVTADGRLLNASESEHPELFWAVCVAVAETSALRPRSSSPCIRLAWC